MSDQTEPGFDVRHLVVTTDNIDMLLAWYAHVAAVADDTHDDFRLAEYLRERKEAGPTR